MENDKLSNHIPNYPDQEDQNFNGKMNAKVEIQKNTQTNIQYENDGNNEANKKSIFRNHQKLQQVYLAPQTGNRYLLIWHDPGLGKTGTAIGIAESRHEWIDQIITSNDLALKLNTHKALIIAQNKMSLFDNFSKDIMTKFTAGAYVTEQHTKHKYENEAAKKGSETTSIKHSYELQTHLAFAKKLSKMSNQEISKTYSFRVIIIDEVHILKTVTKIVEDEHGNTFEGTIGTGSRSKGTKFSHDQLMRLKENTYGCVIVILTGTPTVNIIQEFPSLINFITDKDNQVIPNGPGSFGEIIDRYGNDLNQLRLALQEYLIPKVTGRVSRMKLSDAQKKSIIRHNDGSALLKNTDKRLWLTRIDNNNLDEINYDYIQSAYKRALGLDEIGSSQQTIRVSDDSFYQ